MASVLKYPMFLKLTGQTSGIKQTLWKNLVQHITEANQVVIGQKLAEIQELSRRNAEACRTLTRILLDPQASVPAVEQIPQLLLENNVQESVWMQTIEETVRTALQGRDKVCTSLLTAAVFEKFPNLAWFRTGLLSKVADVLEREKQNNSLQEMLKVLEAKLQEKATYRNSSDLADIQQKLGDSYLKTGHRDAAFQWIRKALIIRANSGADSAAASSFQLGQIAMEKNQPEVAVKYLLYAAETFKKLDNCSGLAACYSVIAAAYDELGESYEVEKYSELATNTLRFPK